MFGLRPVLGLSRIKVPSFFAEAILTPVPATTSMGISGQSQLLSDCNEVVAGERSASEFAWNRIHTRTTFETPISDIRDLARWQRKLLPYMARFLIVLAFGSFPGPTGSSRSLTAC